MQENGDSTLSILVNKPKVFGKSDANGKCPSSQKLNKQKKSSDLPSQRKQSITPKPAKTAKKLPNSSSKPVSKQTTPKPKKSSKLAKTNPVVKTEETNDYDDYDYDDPEHYNSTKPIKSARQKKQTEDNGSTLSEKSNTSGVKLSIIKKHPGNQESNQYSEVTESGRVSNYSQKRPSSSKRLHSNQQAKSSHDSITVEESEPEQLKSAAKENSESSYGSKQEGSSHLGEQISELINSILSDPGSISSDQLSDAATRLRIWQKNILSKVSPLENAQIRLWYESLLSLFIEQNITSNNIEYKDHMMKKAREIIQSHRFSYPGGHTHRFKFVVSGPDGSGKSTFLSAISQQLLIELIASGNWKQTFIFPINILTIAPLCQDLGSFFVEISRTTIQALAAQRPLILKYKDSLIRTFADVIHGKPLLPKSFTLDDDFKAIHQPLQAYLNQCYQLYHNSTGIVDFSISTFMIPLVLSKIFGFHDLVVIIDHFDVADVTFGPSPPFDESTDTIFIVECFKYLLNRSSFIIGYKYEMALSGILSPVDPLTSTFANNIEFISTLGVVCDSHNEENQSVKSETQTGNAESNNEGINSQPENPNNETQQLPSETDNTEHENDQIQTENANSQNEKKKEYPHQKFSFNISFQEPDEPPLTICSEMFAGCALYLTYYDRLCEIVEIIEQLEDDEQKNSENVDVEEEKLKLVMQMQNLLKVTMRSQDRGPYNLSVKSVAFTRKEKK